MKTETDTTDLTFVTGVSSPETVNKSAFGFLAEQMSIEPHLLHPRSESLEESFREGLSLIIMADGLPIAHTRLIPLLNGWYELGSTWVHPQHRHKGLSNVLYERFLGLHKDKNVLATTTNPIAMQTGRHLHFVTVRRAELPEQVWRASCSCSPEKTGCHNGNRSCHLAFGEVKQNGHPLCYFRVTPETAGRVCIDSSR